MDAALEEVIAAKKKYLIAKGWSDTGLRFDAGETDHPARKEIWADGKVLNHYPFDVAFDSQLRIDGYYGEYEAVRASA